MIVRAMNILNVQYVLKFRITQYPKYPQGESIGIISKCGFSMEIYKKKKTLRIKKIQIKTNVPCIIKSK